MRAEADYYSLVRPDPPVQRRKWAAWTFGMLLAVTLVVGLTVQLLRGAYPSTIATMIGLGIGYAGGATVIILLIVHAIFGDKPETTMEIDSAGLSLSRGRIKRLEWAQIAGVELVEWHGWFEGLEMGGAYVKIRLAGLSPTVPKTGLRRSISVNLGDHNAIHAAIARHAPTVPVSHHMKYV